MKTATKKSSLDRVIRSINLQTQQKTLRPLLEWIDYHKVQLRPDQPFDLTGHEYLRDIYQDNSPERVFKKAAQIGMSTEEVLRALWYADQYVCKIGYYFPTDGDVQDFGNDRFDPLVQGTPYFREQVQERAEEGGTYNKGLKQIGRSTVYMRGLWTRTKAKSIDLDALAFDEVDEIKPEMLKFAQDRILHSSLGFMSWLSQPSLPDFGIDAEFADTDQRHWLIKCPSCGEWNCLERDFPQTFREYSPHFIELSRDQQKLQGRQYYRGCSKCSAELDMAVGMWVPEHPSRRRRGYWISGLYTQVRSQAYPEPADRIMSQFVKCRTTDDKSRFVISLIGDAYGGDNKPITEDVLNQCEAEYSMGPLAGTATGIGIDVGDVKHIVVRGRSPEGASRILWMESTESWARLAEIIQLYHPPVFICDAMPYKDNAKSLVRAFRGQGYIQYFKEQEKVTTEENEAAESVPVVHVDRTETLDQTCAEFKEDELKNRIQIPAMKTCHGEQLVRLEEFRSHLKRLVVDQVEDARGIKKRMYKSNVPNHYGMAANSARIAEKMGPFNFGDWSVSEVRAGEMLVDDHIGRKVFGV